MALKRFDQINVLPFIDIMLVLLVIVLTSASFVSKGAIPVDLPKAGSKRAPAAKSLNIVIDRKGRFYFNAKRVTFERLRSEIDALDPKRASIVIRSDAKSQFQNFVRVIDLLKRRGFAKISIETKR